MAIKKPLVLTNGAKEQLQAGDGIDSATVGGFTPSQTPVANTIPVTDANGLLNSWNNNNGIRTGLFDRFITVNSVNTGILVKSGTVIPLLSGSNWKIYSFLVDTEITALDTGTFVFGTNYYVYLCDDGTSSGLLILSANSTYPLGYTATNSRKIGGFHYGRIRNSFTIADVTANVVIPNSVWDLVHRPTCSPEGMVNIGKIWVDIYEVSIGNAITFSAGNGSPITTGTGLSIYNAIPLTGTEGLSGYNFTELAMRSSKRLLTYTEWLNAAYGSPQGNDADNVNAWSATTNTARANTGSVVNAISINNVVDCVANVWEQLNEFATRPDGTTGWGYYDVMSGKGVGQLYIYTDTFLVQLAAGGNWNDGVRTGSRTANLINYPWGVNTGFGSRFACDNK